MSQQWSNNAEAPLASGISAVDVNLSVPAGLGALFEVPSGGRGFFLTITDASNNIEIVWCTARSTDLFTIERAKQGTAARAWNAGDIVGLYPTKAGYQELLGIGAAENVAIAGGTVDAITVTFAASLERALRNGQHFIVQSTGANTVTTPSLAVTLGSTAISSKTIVKFSNQPLEPGDIPGADYPCLLQYDASLDKFVLMNPAKPMKAKTQAQGSNDESVATTAFVSSAVGSQTIPAFLTFR